MAGFLRDTKMMPRLLIFIIFFGAFALSSKVFAATPGEEKTFEDRLVEHADTRYTHHFPNVKVNLILKPQFNDWIGSKVRVKVKYTTEIKFKVTSMELLQEKRPQSNNPDGTIGDALSSFRGYLSLSPIEGRDYRIIGGRNAMFIDFDAPSNLNSLLGKQVELTYTGTDQNPVFKEIKEVQ